MSLLTGCARYQVEAPPWPSLPPKAQIAVLPLANGTTTPYAGRRAQAIIAAALQQAGFQVVLPPSSPKTLPPPVGKPFSISQETLSWAREHGLRYLVGGTVTEWRYKAGLEGMPAVALTLVLYELQGERIRPIWSANLAGIGHGRQSLGLFAQKLILKALP